MLRKDALVTVVPGTPGQAYRAASHTCYGNPPMGTGGDSVVPTPPPAPSAVDPDAGTPIWLDPAGEDGYASVAPAPSGYVCRYETVYVYAPGQIEPSAVYNIVCSEG